MHARGWRARDWERLARHDLIWERPPTQWVDGVPLANGRIGAVLWRGGDRTLCVTLDKYDAWDMREVPLPPDKAARCTYANLRDLVRAGRADEASRVCASLPKSVRGPQPTPTRIVLPRLEVDGRTLATGRLRLDQATWDASTWAAFVHAARPLFVVRGLAPGARVRVRYANDKIREAFRLWEYPELEQGEVQGGGWAEQRYPFGGGHALAWRVRADGTLLVSVYSHRDAEDFRAAAVDAVAAGESWDALHAEHAAWWRDFWQRSRVELPDGKLENLYYAELYKLGSSVRPDGAPISLQGVWSPDGQMPPPWRNDYHLNMNVQESYWPIYASNHLDLGHSLYAFFDRLRPRMREGCRRFLGVDGLWCKQAIGFEGANLPSREGSVFAPMQTFVGSVAWIAHHFWLHWRYSRDEEFLRTHAVPMLRGAWRAYVAALEPSADGRLHIPLSNSPEYLPRDHRHRWHTDTTIDAALIRFLGRALLEANRVLDEPADPDDEGVKQVLDRLYDYPGEDEFFIAEDLPLGESHRHFSHLMPIHPLALVTVEGTEADRRRIDKSLVTVHHKGTGGWSGWSYPWMSCIAAWTGRPGLAWKMLQDYFAFVAPNTFHLNAPRGSSPTHAWRRPFTLEAGFCAAAAMLEMLLQSWGGRIRVFPGVPEFWPDAAFDNLLAEGAVLVSARKRAGAVRWVELESRLGGPVRVKNPFDGPARAGERVLDGDDLRLELAPGERVRLSAAEPPAPAPPAPEPQGPGHWFGLKRVPRFWTG